MQRAEKLEISYKLINSIVVVYLSGRLDSAGSPILQEKISSIASESKFAVLNFTNVDYISSIGIRALLMLEKALRAKGGRAALTGVTPNIRQALEMSGLSKEFPSFDSTETALEKLSLELNSETTLISKNINNHDYSIEYSKNAKSDFEVWGNYRQNVEVHPGIDDFSAVSMSELGISVGMGGFGSNSAIAAECPGEFITMGSFAAISPACENPLADYISTQAPDNTYVYALSALSVSGKPFATINASFAEAITFETLVTDLMSLKNELSPDSMDNIFYFISADLDYAEKVYSNSITDTISGNRTKSEINSKSAIIVGAATSSHGRSSDSDRYESQFSSGFFVSEKGIRFKSMAIFLEQRDERIFASDTESMSAILCSLDNLADCGVIHPESKIKNARISLYVPNAILQGEEKRLEIEYFDGNKFPQEFDIIIRKIYNDSGKVILKPLQGGFSSKTFFVDSYDLQGRRQLPTVLKIASVAVTQREVDAYRKYVEKYILNNSTTIMGSAQYSDWAGLRYNFVGITGAESKLVWLEKLYFSRSTEEIIQLFNRIFTNILKPWYGQPKLTEFFPYKDHDPRKLFTTLEKAAQDELGISSDEPELDCPELGRKLTNPYYFLKHEFPKRRENKILWYKSIVHGDLNMKNILLDEQQNVYVIDFSETRECNITSDFARIEPILKFETIDVTDEDELKRLLEFELGLAAPTKIGDMPEFCYTGTNPAVKKAYDIICRMRKYADITTLFETNFVPHILALLEWTLPVAAYYGMPLLHKRYATYSAAILCGKILELEK